MFLQPSYKEKYERSKDKNVFKPTDTEQYKAAKINEKTSSDVSRKVALILPQLNVLLLIITYSQLSTNGSLDKYKKYYYLLESNL